MREERERTDGSWMSDDDGFDESRDAGGEDGVDSSGTEAVQEQIEVDMSSRKRESVRESRRDKKRKAN